MLCAWLTQTHTQQLLILLICSAASLSTLHLNQPGKYIANTLSPPVASDYSLYVCGISRNTNQTNYLLILHGSFKEVYFFR